MTDIKCEECEKSFETEESLNMHNKSKHPEKYKAPKQKMDPQQKKKIRNWSIFVIIVVIIVGGISFLVLSIKTLPPTDPRGHSEDKPPSHAVKNPMSISMQRHMLEHSDGDGPPGVIINYNCEDYICEPDLISKLEKFVEKYPNNVYVAPFPDMDAKIALTRAGRQKTLKEFDQSRIEFFILSG